MPAADLDTGQRTFASGGYETEVAKRSSWITIRGRGGSLMMSLEEVDDVIAVAEAARRYISDAER
jgi:hypothetical protein